MRHWDAEHTHADEWIRHPLTCVNGALCEGLVSSTSLEVAWYERLRYFLPIVTACNLEGSRRRSAAVPLHRRVQDAMRSILA
ncbi:MAG: hypothetical protein QM784_32870 [Polyangiaceae bacterium]